MGGDVQKMSQRKHVTDLGDAARSREVLERALVIQKRAYGPEHTYLAMTLLIIGSSVPR